MINHKQIKKECAQSSIAWLGTPEDIGNAVLFLASDLSSWISGAHLVVDGGGIA
ncbi:MAG: SDR family oxidoreductase [Mangrovibacterium sp.]